MLITIIDKGARCNDKNKGSMEERSCASSVLESPVPRYVRKVSCKERILKNHKLAIAQAF